MCDVSGGRATAAAIPGAKLVIIDGWGHNLPQQLWPELATHITGLVHHTEAITATTWIRPAAATTTVPTRWRHHRKLRLAVAG